MPKRISPKQANDPLDERLLSAAVEVFLEKGFAAASVDEIAARAKASKLTFYSHYGNKEGLFRAVLSRQNAAMVAVLEASLPDGLSLREYLETIASRLFAALLKGDTVQLVRVLHAEADRFPQLGNVFDEAGPGRAMKLLAAEISKRMACGTLRKADPAVAAEHFVHLALGELSRRVLLGVRPTLGKAETSKRIAAGIDVFLRAYGSDKE